MSKMTKDEALAFVDRILWKFEKVGLTEVIISVGDLPALYAVRVALAEYDVSEKAWDIKQRQLEKMTAEVERMKEQISAMVCATTHAVGWRERAENSEAKIKELESEIEQLRKRRETREALLFGAHPFHRGGRRCAADRPGRS